jgi:hypothetical protein
MGPSKSLEFTSGINIAMKIPPHEFEETVHFYLEVIGLKLLEELSPSIVFQ